MTLETSHTEVLTEILQQCMIQMIGLEEHCCWVPAHVGEKGMKSHN